MAGFFDTIIPKKKNEGYIQPLDQKSKTKVLYGEEYNNGKPIFKGTPLFTVPGAPDTGNAIDSIPITEDLLSRHLMILGGIGTGKTNTFYHLMDGIEASLGKEDIAIIFDSKGDFYKEFHKPGDIVISNDDRSIGLNEETDYWNILEEIDANHPMESIRDICTSLFKENLKKSSNPFFPNAAIDLLCAIMYIFYNLNDAEIRNNQGLLKYLSTSSIADLSEILEKYDGGRFESVRTHISNTDSGQAMGVVAEMNAVIHKLFIGNFAKAGHLGLSELVRKRGGIKVFIEYDIKTGEALTPIYSLMVDSAIKEALSNTESDSSSGSVYILADEFKLLPNLNHIDDAVNFGRSMGIKMIIGLQAITQIYDNYGEYRAKNILSGFMSSFFFRVNNYESREYIKNYFGTHLESISFVQQYTEGVQLEKNEVIKDKDVTSLGLGEAIIAIPNISPFKL